MMNWQSFVAITLLFYCIHDVILKHLADSINPILASIIINVSAALVMVAVAFFYRTPQDQAFGAVATSGQVGWLVVAGASLGLATATLMHSFAIGGQFSVVIPLVYVGIIVLSSIIGYLFFTERITGLQLFGILLSSVGLYLITKSEM